MHITDAGRFIVTDVDGKAMPVPLEEYKARLAARLVQEVPTLDDFRARWIDPPSRQELVDTLVTSGYSPTVVRMVDEKEDYDLYDVLAELGWGMNPRTRHDRTLAFTYKHEDWINALPGQTAATIRAIASQFERGGTDGLENPQIFQTPEVQSRRRPGRAASGGQPARPAGRDQDEDVRGMTYRSLNVIIADQFGSRLRLSQAGRRSVNGLRSGMPRLARSSMAVLRPDRRKQMVERSGFGTITDARR